LTGVHPFVEKDQNFFIYHIYKQSPTVTNDIMAILLITNEEANPVNLSVSIEGINYYEIDIEEVGPHPGWDQWFNASFIQSAPIKIESTNYDLFGPNRNFTINMLFKKQVRPNQPRPCLAIIDDWYWHPLDNDTTSPLANHIIFKTYRESFTSENNQTEVLPPKKRWRCTYNPDVVIESPDYLKQLGLSGNKIDQWGTYALIDNPALNGPQPPGDLIQNPTGPQIYLIIAGGALFAVILVAMIIAHATDENAPSLKC